MSLKNNYNSLIVNTEKRKKSVLPSKGGRKKTTFKGIRDDEIIDQCESSQILIVDDDLLNIEAMSYLL